MKKSDRKKLTASEYYFEQIMSILYTKLKVIVSEDEKSEGRQIFNFENYEHGTISVTGKNGVITARLDGTNFVVKLYQKKDGSVVYRNEQLGIEYILSQKELDDQIKLKSIIRRVGDSADYIKYLVANDSFFVVLDFHKKDEKGISSISNNIAYDYNDDELIAYTYEQMEKAEEVEANGQDVEDDESKEEDVHTKKGYPTCEYETDGDYDEEEEIQSFSNDEEYDDYLVIDYQSDLVEDVNTVDKPYSCDLPSRVQDFDYEKFIKESKYVDYKDGGKLSCKLETAVSDTAEEGQKCNLELKNVKSTDSGIDIDINKDDDFSSQMDDLVAQIYEEQIKEDDLIVSSEGFINEDVYDLTVNGEEVFDESKGEYVDDFFVEVQDIDMEMTTIADYCCDLSKELDKMKEIIRRRKIQIEKNKNKDISKNKNVSLENDEDNIDIE